MTPMIDIVFLLIIFFMVAAQFAQQAHVQLDLPEENGEQNENKTTNSLVINILNDGSLLLDNSQGVIALQEIDDIVAHAVQIKQVDWNNITIRADKNANSRALNEVLVVLNKHGLEATNIATELP
jgi:biopolymer transport protein ExbD